MSIHEGIKINILDEIRKQLEANQVIKEFFPTLEQFLEKYFVTYGEDFVKRLELFGCTELKEDKLVLHNWVKEFASGIGDLRLYHVLTTGNAQCGKSLLNTLLMVDFLVFVGQNLVWFYPTKTQVDALVPGMFGRVVRSYIQNVVDYFAKAHNKNLDLIGKNDRSSNSNFQVRGATAYFRYASTSGKDHTEQKKGLAVVGGSASSITANGLFIDERSQIQPEAIGTLFRRLDAARIPGGFIREIGTPGAGLGIEAVIENAHYHFYPHIICKNCKNIVALDPKGCLLRPLDNDPKKFLSPTGRPVNWFYKDESSKIDTAYFGCPKCSAEISDQDRLNAHFRCLKTGTSWCNFQKSLPTTLEGSLKNRHVVAFHLSPLLRQTKFNLAINIIRTGSGFENTSTRDFQQQMLGHPSENDCFSITKEMLKDAMQVLYPQTEPTCTIAGIDQGRSEDWMWICQYWVDNFIKINGRFYYQSENNISPVMCIENAKRRVIFAEAINRRDIPRLLKKYKVDYGFMDNEPDIPSAYEISKSTCLDMADQKTTILDIVKEIHVYGGSFEIPAYGIYSDYFKDAVLNAFIDKKISMFEFDVNDKSFYSPAKHLTGCVKDPVTLKWERASDHVDDLFFSAMFCESAFHTHINEQVDLSENSISWYSGITPGSFR